MFIHVVDAGDTSSSQAPHPAGHHQHLVADMVKDGGEAFAMVRLSGSMTRPADDDALVQDALSLLLEPPIA